MKKVLSLALVVLMIAACFTVFTVSSSAEITYTFKDGVLTITGDNCGPDASASMADYPWGDEGSEMRTAITEVVVGDGITAIGGNAFAHCENLTKVTLGKDVTTLNMDAFAYCGTIDTMIFNGPVTSIKQGSVYSSYITNLTITGQTWAAFVAAAKASPYNNSFYEAQGEIPAPTVTVVAGEEAIPLVVAPAAKAIMNQFTKTWITFSGISSEFKDKLVDGTLTMKVQIADETEGKLYTIDKYVFGEQVISGTDREFYDLSGTLVMRLSPCDYNIIPKASNSYTLKIEIFEGNKLRYNGTSLLGAFKSTDTGSATKFVEGGAIVPATIPHSCTVSEGGLPVEKQTIKAEPAYGGFENWVNSPNNPKGKGEQPGVTQLIMKVTTSAGTIVDLDYKSDDYTWEVFINGAKYTWKPATQVSAGNFRFEPCISDPKFVPTKDASYEIGLKIYVKGQLAYETAETATFTCPMDPVYEGDIPKPPVEDKGYTFENGVLTITKTFEDADTYPWSEVAKADITKGVVADGVTRCPKNAFSRCDNITEISFGKDCVEIGKDAFSYDSKLATVRFNATVTTIGQGIVYSSKNIADVYITGQTFEEFKAIATVKLYNFQSNGGIATGFDTCTFHTDKVDPPVVEPTKLGGYVTAAGHTFEYVNDVLCLAYDFDVAPVVSADFWNKKSNYGFAVTFYKDGKQVAFKEETPVKAAIYNDEGTDTSLWFAVPFAPEFGAKYTYRVDVWAKDNTVAYYVEEADIECKVKPITEDLSGESEGIVWTLDKATRTLTLDNQFDGELLPMADAPWGEYAASIKTIVVKGNILETPNAAFAHCGADTIIFEEGVSVLGGDTFAYCGGLKTVYLPKSLTKYGQGISYGSDSIETVNYAGSENDWGLVEKNGFYNDNVTNNLVYNVPAPQTGDSLAILAVLAIVAMLGTAVVVSKKVFSK